MGVGFEWTTFSLLLPEKVKKLLLFIKLLFIIEWIHILIVLD
jgi:hypothetical protein